MSAAAFSKTVTRIRQRTSTESDAAGRVYEKALRRRAENHLSSLGARFQALMDILPQGLLVIDGRTGVIKEANTVACDLFLYDRTTLVGMSVEELVPGQKKRFHGAYRLGFLASVRKREMGYHPPIQGVRSDGSHVDMAIALTANSVDDDVMAVCTEHCQWKSAVEAAHAMMA
jgi:PAS domain S-box-containing protein